MVDLWEHKKVALKVLYSDQQKVLILAELMDVTTVVKTALEMVEKTALDMVEVSVAMMDS